MGAGPQIKLWKINNFEIIRNLNINPVILFCTSNKTFVYKQLNINSKFSLEKEIKQLFKDMFAEPYKKIFALYQPKSGRKPHSKSRLIDRKISKLEKQIKKLKLLLDKKDSENEEKIRIQ